MALEKPVLVPPVSSPSGRDVIAAVPEPHGFRTAGIDLKRFAARLNDYFERLERKKASHIEPVHVRKILDKLEAKKAILREELEAAWKPEKQERLAVKLTIVQAQISRATDLLREIEASA